MVMMNRKDRKDIQSAVDTLRLMMGARMPEEVKALHIAENCMKKQLPHKPEIRKHTDLKTVYELQHCPNCGEVIKFEPIDKEEHPVTWCWLCGQALDWRSDD